MMGRKTFSFAAKLLCLTAVVFSTQRLAVCAPGEVVTSPNLVNNSGFEKGVEEWNFTEDETKKVVSDVSRNGGFSLQCVNDNPQQVVGFGQALNVVPGQRIQFSVWVKGEDVKGVGAGLYVQSYQDSRYVSGSFPVTITGTFDWTQVTGEYTVPDDATRTSLGIYMRKHSTTGTTGKVWFDDVEVRSFPFAITTLRPNYRGLVKQGDGVAWKNLVEVYPEPQWPQSAIKATSELADDTGKVLASQQYSLLSSKKQETIAFEPPRNLPAGQYTLTHRITDPNGAARLVRKDAIQVVEKMPRVYLDSKGFTMVDGERFFPLGVYLAAATDREEDLERISKGGFNTVLSYLYGFGRNAAVTPEGYMDLAHKHDLKVVYSLKDMYPRPDGTNANAFRWAQGYIERVKDKPALLAWYTNDEMPPSTGWLPKLEEMYDLVKKHDNHGHPTFHAHNKYASLPYSYHVTDILATDLYPVGLDPNLRATAHSARQVSAVVREQKGMWMVPQIFDWAVYKPDYKQHFPSLDEMRNQSYQAIINGAQGLIFYSYFDLIYEKYPHSSATENRELLNKRWPDVAAMVQEIKEIVPAILSDKKVPLSLPRDAAVEVSALQEGNELLLLFANPYYEAKSIDFKLPPGWRPKSLVQGQVTGTVRYDNATFNLPGLGCGVYRLVRR